MAGSYGHGGYWWGWRSCSLQLGLWCRGILQEQQAKARVTAHPTRGCCPERPPPLCCTATTHQDWLQLHRQRHAARNLELTHQEGLLRAQLAAHHPHKVAVCASWTGQACSGEHLLAAAAQPAWRYQSSTAARRAAGRLPLIVSVMSAFSGGGPLTSVPLPSRRSSVHSAPSITNTTMPWPTARSAWHAVRPL